MSSGRLLLIALILLLPPRGGLAAAPLEDIGFSSATPPPDPDVVIVREKAYGAGGVDLTAYGIGSGPVDFVQSIYFRFYVDSNPDIESFTGRVLFPPGITILGVITGASQLGGSVDDGLATETDAIFGIGSDPDAYSECDRGFECCGGPTSSEFVCVNSERSLVFGLDIGGCVDDFRVIVDYGDSFPDDLAFDVSSYHIGLLGGVVPSKGFRVGDDTNPVVPGSGDFGEAESLLHIPLTASAPPDTAAGIPFDPLANLFILRDTTVDTYIDAYDTGLDLPAPNMFALTADTLNTPAGITDGDDGLLYAVGQGYGFAVADPVTGGVTMAVIPDLTGNNADLTNLPGYDDLFLVRDTTGDTYVDRLDVATRSFVASWPISSGVVGTPQGIADAADSLLYVVGSTSGFASVNPATGAVVNIGVAPPTGNYVSLTGRPGVAKLYLLRNTAGNTFVDVYDIATGTKTYDFASMAAPADPAAITDGPGGFLYAIGAGVGQASWFTVMDPHSGQVVSSNACMNFDGTNVAMTNLGTVMTTVGEPRAAPRRPLLPAAEPNPFQSSTLIRFELDRPARVTAAVFDVRGRLIRALADGVRGSGHHAVVWDGRDEGARPVPAGVYFYRLDLGGEKAWGKVVRQR